MEFKGTAAPMKRLIPYLKAGHLRQLGNSINVSTGMATLLQI